MIHYHGTPVSGKRLDAITFLTGRHAFVTFSNPDDLPIVMEVCRSFALDNGAYSVWRKGGRLDVAGYYRWVEKVQYHPRFDFAIIPDVIDGSEKENATLVAQWPFGSFRGVPVWHLHESLEWLRFLAGSYPRVALGSSGDYSFPGTPNWWCRLAEVMNEICNQHGQPYCKLHGLRMLNPDIFTRLPLASADSTNAVRNGNLITRFGIYPPTTVGQRMSVIADRIEANQSASCWVPWQASKQGLLFDDSWEN